MIDIQVFDMSSHLFHHLFFLGEYSRKLTVLENTVFPKSPLFLFTSTFQGDFYIFSENFQIPIDKPASLCGRDY